MWRSLHISYELVYFDEDTTLDLVVNKNDKFNAVYIFKNGVVHRYDAEEIGLDNGDDLSDKDISSRYEVIAKDLTYDERIKQLQ